MQRLLGEQLMPLVADEADRRALHHLKKRPRLRRYVAKGAYALFDRLPTDRIASERDETKHRETTLSRCHFTNSKLLFAKRDVSARSPLRNVTCT